MTAHMTSFSSGRLNVAIVPHPFAVERVCASVSAGLSVADIIRDIQPDPLLAKCAHVFINGDYVPQDKWTRVYPKPAAIISIRMVPMGGGGGGKNPLRTILTLAVVAISPAIAGALGGMVGTGASFLGMSVGKIITTGVNLLGRLAINAIAPPARPKYAKNPRESATLFIQGARNQAMPFGRVPKVLGKHRFVPPLGALPYTETSGKDQYLRMLFVWGYGPLHISDLKIGETPLSEFDDVEVETRHGYDDDAPLTLYTNSVLQNDLQVTLKQEDGFITRTSENDADEISVDITLPRGLFMFNGTGGKVSRSVQLEVQYSPVGMNDWSAGAVSYKTVSAQNAAMPAKPSPQNIGGNLQSVARIDRICIDPASGVIKVVAGTAYRINGTTPPETMLPQGFIPLARVERRSSDSGHTIAAGRITDERVENLFGGTFENSGSFAPSASLADNQVTIAAGGIRFSGLKITAKQTSALRKSVSFKVPRGQYDVRVRRVTADSNNEDIFDETVWTALRTTRYTQPVRMTGLAMTAIRIRATDQLNGVIDRFNGVVESIIPDWTGAEWVLQPTSNPASLYRHVLQGRGNARPLADTRLDLGKIEQWHENCTQAGRAFNAVIDFDVSVHEMLHDIAAAGRASPALIDGKWGVIEDKPQSVPVQHFTPRNSFGFQGRKSFDELPHALRVRFINAEKGWIQDERLVFDDGYSETNAEKYETLELQGITSPEQAWKDGRYHIATARLRPETYSFHADIEHIVCTRGDLIRFSHDVPMFGIASARVKSVTLTGDIITGVILDAAVQMETGKSYAVRFRKSDGSSLVRQVATSAGTSDTLVFTGAGAEGPQTGDLALFGISGQESVELIVKSIEPQGDMAARLTCVDASPAVHLADSGVIPEFRSQVTLPPELLCLPVPVLDRIQSGEEVLIRHTDGSFTTRIVVSLLPPTYGAKLEPVVMIKADGETTFRRAEILSASETQLSITDVEEDDIYDIHIRYKSLDGSYSAPLLIPGHHVTGTTALPSDVTGFSLRTLGDTLYLSWTPVQDIDLHHYVIRYTPLTSGVGWSNAVDIVSQVSMDASSIALPAASGSYLIKAVDVGGRLSQNPAIVFSNAPSVNGFNAVSIITESALFAGEKENVARGGDFLQLDVIDKVDSWDNIDDIENTDMGREGLHREGSYVFAETCDLGAVYTSRLTANMLVSGIDYTQSIDTIENNDLVESWDQDIDPSLWFVALELRMTQDDPSATPEWGEWMPFVIGDYTARAFQFRLKMQSFEAFVTPAISSLSVTVDMPDRTVSRDNLISDPAGSSISFSPAFREMPAISITARDLSSGDYHTITSATPSGFVVRFFDSGGNGVSRTFDYLAKGFGTAN